MSYYVIHLGKRKGKPEGSDSLSKRSKRKVSVPKKLNQWDSTSVKQELMNDDDIKDELEMFSAELGDTEWGEFRLHLGYMYGAWLGCFILHFNLQINFIIKPSVPLGKVTTMCDFRQIPIIFRPPPYRDIPDGPISGRFHQNSCGYLPQSLKFLNIFPLVTQESLGK